MTQKYRLTIILNIMTEYILNVADAADHAAYWYDGVAADFLAAVASYVAAYDEL